MHPLDNQTRKRKLINCIREFAHGKTKSEYDAVVHKLHCWAAGVLGMDGELDRRSIDLFEQVEREIFKAGDYRAINCRRYHHR